MSEGRKDRPRSAATLKPDALPRLLSKLHVASRKEAEAMVRAGRVTVDGVPRRDVMFKADPGRQRIAVDGKVVDAATSRTFAYVALNKPRGAVSTMKDPEGRPAVAELVAAFPVPGLAPVGRLDQASAGLLLFTNDHDLADGLLAPASHVPKTYRVKVRGVPDEAVLTRMRTEKVRDGADEFAPIEVEIERAAPQSAWLQIVLREGRNRQLRRQLLHFGHEVETLIRTRFGPIALGDLAPGSARALDLAEIKALRSAVRVRSRAPSGDSRP